MSLVGGERGFVTVDGRRVLVSRYGRGPAFIVIHGSPPSSRAVAAVSHAIAARGLTAIALDTPGARRSDPPLETWAASTLANHHSPSS